jgi:hypothetical protein
MYFSARTGLHHDYYWQAAECVGQGRGQPRATITEADVRFLRAASVLRIANSHSIDRTTIQFPVLLFGNRMDDAFYQALLASSGE